MWTDSWKLGEPDATKTWLETTMSSAINMDVGTALDLRSHLHLCLGHPPSEQLFQAFRRVLFDMLVLGVEKPIDMKIEGIELQTLLLGYHLPYSVSDRKMSMVGGTLARASLVKIMSDDWHQLAASLPDFHDRPKQRGLVAEAVVLSWLKGLAGADSAASWRWGRANVLTILPLLKGVPELENALCSPSSFSLTSESSHGPDITGELQDAAVKLAFQCKSFGETQSASELGVTQLGTEIIKVAKYREKKKETNIHYVLVIICSRLEARVQALLGSQPCIFCTSGVHTVPNAPTKIGAETGGESDIAKSGKGKKASRSKSSFTVPQGMTVVLLNPQHDTAFLMFTGVTARAFSVSTPKERTHS